MDSLREPLVGYDFDSFLAPETQRVCDEWLAEHPLGHMKDRRNLYLLDCLALKAYLEQYVAENREPRLEFNVFPRGGPTWYRDQMEQAREDVRRRGYEADDLADWFKVNVQII
ncbi:hypothetical protein F5Y06DRAFT_270393 [Hypoxylon sp. FL0890]|nr:hypothetical protein F5Y06DRAFT_270393 [Hypoxylon sp. FL0890]